MAKSRIIALTLIIAGLAIALLINHRLSQIPAPETTELIDVFAATADTHVADTPLLTYLPGQIITTPTDQFYALRTTGPTNAPIFNLDVNSQLKIVATDGNDITVDLITGRLVIDGQVTVVVRNNKIVVDGVVTLVNYSWLNKMDVDVLSGSANLSNSPYSTTITSGNAISFDTLTPSPAAPTTFSVDAGSVKAFYDWALGR